MEDVNPESIFQNMQHSIVNALHVLGEHSAYNDGSVRMKELFSMVENSTIVIDGKPQHGNHRFSAFSSALNGRHSAQELFQRVEEPNREGAWWKLKVPYEQAIELACKQKCTKAAQKRNRKANESFILLNKPQNHFKIDRDMIVNNINKIENYVNDVRKLQECNQALEEQLAQLNNSVSLLKQSISPEVEIMLDRYMEGIKQVQTLRSKLLKAQSALTSNGSFHIQNQSI